MRKYISLFFSAIVVLCACNDNVPDGVLEKEEMVNLLVDVHIADGTMFNVSSQADSAYKYGTGRYLSVFSNHHTDSAQFNRSVKYYVSNPEMLVVMYDTIGRILQRKTDSINKLMQKEQAAKAKHDSSRMMRGKGMMPDAAKKMPGADALKAKQKLKADSIKNKKKLDSVKASVKKKADSIRNKQKQDSLKSKKRIKGKRIKAS